jgi:hypothetical protein
VQVEDLTNEVEALRFTKEQFDTIPGVIEKMKKAKLRYKKFQKIFNDAPEDLQIITVGKNDYSRQEIEEKVAQLRRAYEGLEAKWHEARKNAGMAELSMLTERFAVLQSHYKNILESLRLAQIDHINTVDAYVKLMARAKVAEIGPEEGLQATLAEIREIAKDTESWKIFVGDNNEYLTRMEQALNLEPLPADALETAKEQRDFFQQRMQRVAEALPDALLCTMWINEE